MSSPPLAAPGWSQSLVDTVRGLLSLSDYYETDLSDIDQWTSLFMNEAGLLREKDDRTELISYSAKAVEAGVVLYLVSSRIPRWLKGRTTLAICCRIEDHLECC